MNEIVASSPPSKYKTLILLLYMVLLILLISTVKIDHVGTWDFSQSYTRIDHVVSFSSLNPVMNWVNNGAINLGFRPYWYPFSLEILPENNHAHYSYPPTYLFPIFFVKKIFIDVDLKLISDIYTSITHIFISLFLTLIAKHFISSRLPDRKTNIDLIIWLLVFTYIYNNSFLYEFYTFMYSTQELQLLPMSIYLFLRSNEEYYNKP